MSNESLFTILVCLILLTTLALIIWNSVFRPARPSKTVLHCMLDLETFSLAPNAYIRSIGACFFGASGVGRTFYKVTDGSKQDGAHIDPKTIEWWEGQSQAARDAIEKRNKTTLEDALTQFQQWVAAEAAIYARQKDMSDIEVWMWSNGADFDTVILKNAYERCDMVPPWAWYNARCYRTLKNLFKGVKQRAFSGEKHHALADAIHQADHAAAILRSVYY